MKRISVSLLAVLLLAACAVAEDTTRPMEMSGYLCNAKCVKPSAGRSVCDQSCTDTTSEVVLVDDEGKVLKIANQEKVAQHAGKKVKMKCSKVKGSKDKMNVDSLYLGG